MAIGVSVAVWFWPTYIKGEPGLILRGPPPNFPFGFVRICLGRPKTEVCLAAMTEKSPQSSKRDIADLLRQADLRPTRQRTALASLLFDGPERHVTAELLHAEVTQAGENVSLATVYNTLHQFRRAGLLRELAVDGVKSYFDTNTSNHHHFLIEPDGELMDIPNDSLKIDGVPQAPEGMKITHIDVVVRVTKA